MANGTALVTGASFSEALSVELKEGSVLFRMLAIQANRVSPRALVRAMTGRMNRVRKH